MTKKRRSPLFDALRAPVQSYDGEELAKLLGQVNPQRVRSLTASIAEYLAVNLPLALERRSGLSGYRTNPYVLMASASTMRLAEPSDLASFLFNNKLYMGFETSFGKSIESVFLSHYPLNSEALERWVDPPEKLAEAATLEGLSRQQKAMRRTGSVWREVDKSCVLGQRRYMTTIKSGPNCINDSQVQAMTDAVRRNHAKWLADTRRTYSDVRFLDVVIGITYGTDRTTNNKENQILAKLLKGGFVEEDRVASPGVLVDKATRSVRVYRRVGRDFWAFVGNPDEPGSAAFVFLEILLALTMALSKAARSPEIEARLNEKIKALSDAFRNLMFPRTALPAWVSEDIGEDQLFWFAAAITAFYDEGI